VSISSNFLFGYATSSGRIKMPNKTYSNLRESGKQGVMQNYSFGGPQIQAEGQVLGVGDGVLGAVPPAGSRDRALGQGVRR